MDIDKMEAGPEMNARVAIEVMGWIKTDSNLYVGSPLGRVYAVHKFWNDEDELNKEIETIGELRRINQMFTLWQPSTDISAAWQMDKPEWIWNFHETPIYLQVTLYTSEEIWNKRPWDLQTVAKVIIIVDIRWDECETKESAYALGRCRAALKAVEDERY